MNFMKFNFLLLLLIPFSFYSQKKDSLAKFQVGFGTEIFMFKSTNFDNLWYKLNPNFNEPDQIDTSFKSYSGVQHSTRSNYKLTFQIKNQIKKSKFSFAPRLDLSFGDGLSFHQDWHKTSSYTYDTLTSNSTGEEFYLDSIVFENHTFSYSSKAIGLKIGLNFDYAISKRFTLFSGLTFGSAFNFSHTEINNYYSFYNKEIIGNTFYSNSGSYGINTSERVQYDKTNAMFYPIKVNQMFLGIPIGLTFRLSKKENLLNHFLLSYEYNFSQSYFKIRSKIDYNIEIAKFKQYQHSHLFRLIYEI